MKPPIPGAEHAIISDEILELPEIPKSLIIVGAGYIALEFAGVFANLGVETHLVFRGDVPLRGFDSEVRFLGLPTCIRRSKNSVCDSGR